MRTQKILYILALLVSGFLTSFLAHATSPESEIIKTISGEVWYRERMLLPPNSELSVFLEDVAKMDVPSEVLASVRMLIEGGPPYAFSLEYDPGRLNRRGRYALRARIENDGQLMFINTTSIPAFEGGEGDSVRMRVSKVGRNSPSGKQQLTRSVAVLLNTYWKLIDLDGLPVSLGAGGKELQMVLALEGRARGFSGCNNFSADYQTEQNQLRFGPVKSTRMACVEGMQQEAVFQRALGEVDFYRVDGEQLTLLNQENHPIMRFESVYLQ